jgi:hypothetical protein
LCNNYTLLVDTPRNAAGCITLVSCKFGIYICSTKIIKGLINYASCRLLRD